MFLMSKANEYVLEAHQSINIKNTQANPGYIDVSLNMYVQLKQLA